MCLGMKVGRYGLISMCVVPPPYLQKKCVRNVCRIQGMFACREYLGWCLWLCCVLLFLVLAEAAMLKVLPACMPACMQIVMLSASLESTTWITSEQMYETGMRFASRHVVMV